MTRSTDALLLFDGTCGFCAESVQFVLKHESGAPTLKYASLQSPTGERIRAAHPELDAIDSVIWYQPASINDAERVLVRSTAVLHVLEYLGGVWRVLGVLGRIVPRVLRDVVYDWVARHRHQLIRGTGPQCLLPTPEQRTRFELSS
jgi:predicted DCC family thiol-disulfide oxidoreductase YuxK